LALGKIDLFAECQALALGKTGEAAAFAAFFPALPSATPLALGKAFFAQCWHSAKLGNLLFFCLLLSFDANTQNSYIIHETTHRHLASHKTHT
jgi:hypothetical protein